MNEFQDIKYSVVSSFIDSRVGLELSMFQFSHSIEQWKQVYDCKANDMGVVFNKQMNYLVLTGAC